MSIESNLDINLQKTSLGGTAKSTKAIDTDKQENVFQQGVKAKQVKVLSENEKKYLESKGYVVAEMSSEEIQLALTDYYKEKGELNNAPTPEAKQAVNSKENGTNSSKDTSKLDYNELRVLIFDPQETGVEPCDFESLDKKTQSEFFVKNLTIKQYGEKWGKMTAAEQAEAMKATEADLTENVPSWKDLKPADKAKIVLAFNGSDDPDLGELRYADDVYSKPLNEQIELVAKQVISKRESAEVVEQEKTALNAEFFKNPDAQLKRLQEKAKTKGEDNLTPLEKEYLKVLSDADQIRGELPLKDVFGKSNKDKETSTYALMQKDTNYRELYNAEIQRQVEEAEANGEKVDREKIDAKAELHARTAWFLNQFKGVENNKEALFAKFKELRDNCHTPAEQIALTRMASTLLGLSQNKDVHTAMLGFLALGDSKEEQQEYINQIITAIKGGKLDVSVAAGIQNAVPEKVNEALQAHYSVELNRVGGEDAVKVMLKNTSKYSVEDQNKIFSDAIDNADKYSDKKVKLVLAENIGKTAKENQLKLNEKYNKHAAETKDVKLAKSTAKGIAEYHKDNQVKAASNSMKTSRSFGDEDAVDIQKTVADEVKDCHKDNQLAIHKAVMQSKYSEVQEYAAGNIKDYDATVQTAAIDTVYETKNEKAIAKVIENIEKYPPQVQQIEVVRAIGEVAMGTAMQAGNNIAIIMGGELSVQDLSKLTPSQRLDYFVKMFEEASPAKKLEIIRDMATNSIGIHKKTIYTIIARYSSPLLKSMVESGMGKSMLDTGLPIDVVNKIINIMKISTNNEVIQQLKELQLDSSFDKYFKDDEIADKNKLSTIPNELKGTYAARIDNQTFEKLKKNNATIYLKS